MRYSALDPGKHIGYADCENGNPLAMGEVLCTAKDLDAFDAWLDARQIDLDVLIVEGYRNRPVPMTRGHANTWSENLESQIIGYCKGWCRLHKIEYVEQQPSIKPVGYGMAGLKYTPGKSGTHMLDAVSHASYWWMTKGIKHNGVK